MTNEGYIKKTLKNSFRQLIYTGILAFMLFIVPYPSGHEHLSSLKRAYQLCTQKKYESARENFNDDVIGESVAGIRNDTGKIRRGEQFISSHIQILALQKKKK